MRKGCSRNAAYFFFFVFVLAGESLSLFSIAPEATSRDLTVSVG